jgi:hypothetical protein
MHEPRELYEKRVTLTLAGFQVTEFLLKEYIALSYDVMRHVLRDHIDFSMSRKEIENRSLERLISTFKTVNANQALIKQMQGVVDHRNRMAHKSLLPLYGIKTSDEEYWRLIDEISPLEIEIDRCMEGMQSEIGKLRQISESVFGKSDKSGSGSSSRDLPAERREPT